MPDDIKKPDTGKETTAETRMIKIFLVSFTVFDTIHIITSLVMLIHALTIRPIDAIETAECVVEIVFSFMLICFIHAMSSHHSEVDRPKVTYTMGYLVAAASLFVPLSFNFPEYLEADATFGSDPGTYLELVSLALAMISFFSIMLALIFAAKPKFWKAMVIIGLCAISILPFAEFPLQFYLSRTVFIRIVACIRSAAPLFFAPFGLWILFQKKGKSFFAK